MNIFKNLFGEKKVSTQSVEAEEIWKKSASLMNESPDEAIGLFEQAIKIDPKHMKSYEYIVYVYRQVKGNPTKAIQVGLDALKIDRKHPALLEQIGKAYIEIGEFDRALKIFTKVKLEQATTDTLGYLTPMYILIGQNKKALKTDMLFNKKARGQAMADYVLEQIKRAFVMRK